MAGECPRLEQEMRRAVALADSPLIDWRRPNDSDSQTAACGDSGTEALPSLREALRGFERTFLKTVLARCAERVEAARMLGITRQALHQKLVRHAL
jgi:DNA-binding NtrC family response regulator